MPSGSGNLQDLEMDSHVHLDQSTGNQQPRDVLSRPLQPFWIVWAV